MNKIFQTHGMDPARALYENYMSGEYGKNWEDLPAGVQKRWADALAAGMKAITSVMIEPADGSDFDTLLAAIPKNGSMMSLEAAPTNGYPSEPIELPYKNWRGEVSVRKLYPVRIEFGATEWHPEPQWLLVAWDIEKNAERSFALKDFNPPQSVPSVAVMTLEWNVNDSWNISKTIIGTYVVRPCLATNFLGQWLLRRAQSEESDKTLYASEDEAKAVAQGDYEARILSALSAQNLDVAGGAMQAITDERNRQIGKGYDSAHDDNHVAGDIINSSWGALARIYAAQDQGRSGDVHGYKKYLVQAAAQIVAEYERVDRALAAVKQEGGE